MKIFEIEYFEVVEEYLAARIGILYTRKGKVETPTLAPVINPLKTPFKPYDFKAKFKFDLIITNAYLIKKYFGEDAIKLGIHGILNFKGPIMTDSGAYQILEYGHIDVSPEEILQYQKDIGSDIIVILDTPTGLASREHALRTVFETYRRGLREYLLREEDRSYLIVGPIQGGIHIDLTEYSAYKMLKLDYDIYALGSPTVLLEQYEFDKLVSMMFKARSMIIKPKPMHLFGAGHPIIIPFAVALGFDIFDSASYILYARDDRYLTSYGTLRLNDMKYLPCSCPICSNIDIEDLKSMPKDERVRLIAAHNLYVLKQEIDKVKEAIHEGTLIRLLYEKAYSHPKAYRALKKTLQYIEKLSKDITLKPFIKASFFYTKQEALLHPIVRILKRRVRKIPLGRRNIILIFKEVEKPLVRNRVVVELIHRLARMNLLNTYNILYYDPIYGIIHLELSETYPFSQYELSTPSASLKDICDSILEVLASRDNIEELVVLLHSFTDKEVDELTLNLRKKLPRIGKVVFVRTIKELIDYFKQYSKQCRKP